MPNRAELRALNEVAATLSAPRLRVLRDMANALTRPVRALAHPASDIVVPEFEDAFSAQLLLFHSMHMGALTKKTFEYLFCAAHRAAGRDATLTENAVHPGEDATVDGQRFSLKTEAGKSISADYVLISKLMEARWLRECRTGDDFAREVRSHIGEHLTHYSRVLTLRSFHQPHGYRYDLVEIPVAHLRRVSTLTGDDFSARTKGGSCSAHVCDAGGRPLFTLVLDGSVEKVTVRRFAVTACVTHGPWLVGNRRA
jgi:hypothetical protein